MKKRVVYIALMVATLWPLGQIYLTKAYGLSPWKLAGWGMYATPRIPSPGVALEGRLGAAAPYQPLTSPSIQVRTAARAFLKDYYWLRDLIAPDNVAAALLATNPALSQVRITVFRPEMNSASGMIEKLEKSYEYNASGH